MMGTAIAQLYRLEHSPDPSVVFGYYVLSKPLSVIFQSAALCLTLLGAFRFWRQQSAMAIGKVHAGGWEVTTIGIGFFLVCWRDYAVGLELLTVGLVTLYDVCFAYRSGCLQGPPPRAEPRGLLSDCDSLSARHAEAAIAALRESQAIGSRRPGYCSRS